MFHFFPYHRFDIVTKFSPKIVKQRIATLLKKEEKEKLFEFHFDFEEIFEEEFVGEVEERCFSLKRYSFSNNKMNVMVYKGTIEPTERGSIIHVTFRYDIFFMLMMVFFIAMPIVGFSEYLFNRNLIENPNTTGLYGMTTLFYMIFILGFNYRTFEVKDLLLGLLNARIVKKPGKSK